VIYDDVTIEVHGKLSYFTPLKITFDTFNLTFFLYLENYVSKKKKKQNNIYLDVTQI